MAKRSRTSNKIIVSADPAESAPAISYDGGLCLVKIPTTAKTLEFRERLA